MDSANGGHAMPSQSQSARTVNKIDPTTNSKVSDSVPLHHIAATFDAKLTLF